MRYLVIWHPGFEAGMSRAQTVNALKAAWALKAPQLIERRTVALKTTAHQELFEKVNSWLSETHGRSMPKLRSLNIVLISDPDWETTKEKWLMSCEAMRAGYTYGWEGEKPQFCVLGFETADNL
jgi:hypothetical protein